MRRRRALAALVAVSAPLAASRMLQQVPADVAPPAVAVVWPLQLMIAVMLTQPWRCPLRQSLARMGLWEIWSREKVVILHPDYRENH